MVFFSRKIWHIFWDYQQFSIATLLWSVMIFYSYLAFAKKTKLPIVHILISMILNHLPTRSRKLSQTNIFLFIETYHKVLYRATIRKFLSGRKKNSCFAAVQIELIPIYRWRLSKYSICIFVIKIISVPPETIRVVKALPNNAQASNWNA